MRTNMECRSLGESKANYTTQIHSAVRQIRQQGSDYTTKNESSSGSGVVMGLLAGAAAGVIAGMLLAPDKGTEIRKKVADSATKLGGQMGKTYGSTREAVSGWAEKLAGDKSENTSDAGASMMGVKQKSPYTDTNKWDDQEIKNMTDSAKNTPGV
ncbi:YtxH domain-containing protein [Pontibacter rugosus]|uniref:YtxH domain-containing protein n=1 Tax=Pontibacter rugosus TaxID=1745966 RepID=A0ABW3SSW9_9BACT